MFIKLLAFRDAYLRNNDGATAIEYGLIAAGISLAIVAVAFTFGDELQKTFETMEDKMKTANADAGDTGGTGGTE